jgi:glycosyltransferase involved in cell wall biosynthesis
MPEISSRRPRVLLLLHELSLSGAPRMALQVFQALASEVELRVLSFDEGPLGAPFRELGPTQSLVDWGPERLNQAALKMESRFVGIRGAIVRINGAAQGRVLAKWRPDVIYINSLVSLKIRALPTLAGVPALLHVHETGNALHEFRLGTRPWFESWPSRYIAVSQHVRSGLLEEGIAPEKITVVPNFLSPQAQSELQTLARNRPAKAPHAPFVVGGAGQISWAKGPELWLLMAAELKRLMGPLVRFQWIGGRGSFEDARFELMAKKLGLTEQLEIVAVTPRPFEHYSKFDAFAFTSWEDSFGLVALENMTLGNLVTCFADGGGAPEVVNDGGLIVPHFDPGAMAAQIAQTLSIHRR